MITRNTIVTPCIVKTWLYKSALRIFPSGLINCVRISRASMPPTPKKISAAKPYMIPIFLWSTVVTQLRQPVWVRGRVKTPRGRWVS